MIEKDVCYITTDASEPIYLKGQIIAIKPADSEWSEIERGNKPPENSNIAYAVKTLFIDEDKLNSSAKKGSRLVIIEENGEEIVQIVPKHIPLEIY